MGIIEIIFISIGLAADAFAVSICKGLSVRELKPKHVLITGSWFSVFQMIMPLLGFFLGAHFEKYIKSIDHWIAFVLLSLIGINMIRDSFRRDEENLSDTFGIGEMFVLSVATSIDALAVGITFAFLRADIVPAIIIIGTVTFLLSALGVKIGNKFGLKFKAKAEIIGGCVLILIGIKILLEHILGG